MARTRSSWSSSVGELLALTLAGGGAVLLAVADGPGRQVQWAEPPSTLAWMLGWALLVWAVIVGGACAARLGHGVLTGGDRPTGAFRARLLLLSAGAVVVALVVWTYPPWGGGSGVG